MFKHFIATFVILASGTIQAKEYVITNFGASTDSTVLNTKSIQQTIDKASNEGGGTIVIPQGTFLTGALFFKPNTSLKLLKGAVLKGSDNIADYPLVPSRMEGKLLDYYAALINVYGADHFSLTGPGTINGNGLKFWKYFWAYRDSLKTLGEYATNLEVHRPRLIFVRDSKDLIIRNVSLRDAGFWTTHLYKCTDVLIENCNIRSPKSPVAAPSTDGIDLDVCSNVVVRGCYISVNDDAVCIKGGKGPFAHQQPENGVVENVLIENCTVEYPSPGVVTFGSECVHARNIKVRNCRVINCREIVLLKMRPDTYQTFENIDVKGVKGSCQNLIKMAPWKQFFNLEGSNEEPYGIVKDIRMSDIRVKCNTLLDMNGNKNDQVSNIVLKNIHSTANNEEFKNMYGVKLENVYVNNKQIDTE